MVDALSLDRLVDHDDTFGLYLKETATPLLTAEEERILGECIQAGKAIDHLLKYSPTVFQLLSVTTQDELLRVRMLAQLARERLTRSNVTLIASIAKKYQGRGVSWEDLNQEGIFGLMSAVDKFDPRKGYRFSTYATWWIKQAIARAIVDTGRTIRIPVNTDELMKKIAKTRTRFNRELHRDPTVEEISEELQLTPRKVKFLLQVSGRQWTLSFDEPLSDESDEDWYELIADPLSGDDYFLARKYFLLDMLGDLIINWPDKREREIIIYRFGLFGGYEHTLEETGVYIGVTRERIRQIVGKALFKMRRKLQPVASDWWDTQ